MKKIAYKTYNPYMYQLIILFLLMASIAPGCKKEGKEIAADPQATSSSDNASKYATPGKKHFAINVDGDIREYYVHIPAGYDGSTALPVVFMLHGSGGNGLKFYNISGWVEEGEKENIITVFPSSWKYDCVQDDGIEKHNAEKWNSYDLVVCDNNKKRNDVKFLNTVITKLKQKFAVDTNRIYIVGFSNGGEMAARCAIELSNKFAAVVACAGSLPPDTTLHPKRNLPVWVQIGAADEGVKEKLGITTDLPMSIAQILGYAQIQSVINSYIYSFDLQTNYDSTGNPKKYVMATYQGNSGNPENILSFVTIKGLAHQYPNGTNHPLKGAELHWNWMKKFSLN